MGEWQRVFLGLLLATLTGFAYATEVTNTFKATNTFKTTQWELKRLPSSHPTESIGSYSNGCLAGAKALPLEGEGYQVLRRDRARYYGHPNAIHFIQTLAEQTKRDLNSGILIGDISLPQGGRFSSGHSSHQTGLDIDIWLRLADAPLSAPQLAEPTPLSVVDIKHYQLTQSNWEPRHFELIKMAASDDQVARIFVHPVIKQTLCDSEQSLERAWLRKVRPWWGHHYHMHVRLKCPKGNPACLPQKEPPQGDGCGAELASWKPKPQASQQKVSMSQPKEKLKPNKKRLKPMPEQCLTLLQNQ
ncbi:penicillin-insensitive murein endopeptidase [Vibrio sp. YMD68]|uniref:penicillin-insensitive murein endopeptidase n=1 Tax=Vibrio sp. YMD68 TaxID=3042300 RepID=UPI00249A73DB|nr:penicillin-insensitive murein endopeptidase [Vibrio sp. YMD68]WGV99743.1 penicillin-insensitive murein endopeptidase [Vibrio sp. YMD68]